MNQPRKTTLLYVTDPLCSGCWAFEPVWRKLRFHYDDVVDVRMMYGGLLPAWDGFTDRGASIAAPADVGPHWREVADRTGQPINPQVWDTDPPRSSYPPSKAAHVVRMLDPAAEEPFLRRVREAVFLEARNIARREVLIACAADAGVDVDAFASLFDADAGSRGLATDIRERRAMGVRRFPTLLAAIAGAPPRMLVVGARPWADVEAALRAVGIEPAEPATAPTVDAALDAYRTGTTPEFAALLETTPARAQRLLAEGGATQRRLGAADWWIDERAPLDLDVLEASFDLVAPQGDRLMDVFYSRLFAAAPAVRPLFAGIDLRRQKSMLLAALVLLRKSLRDLDAVIPTLRGLGARHVAYGARPEHYPVVGEVLIAAMAEVAADDWRPEYERAWAAAFDVVAGVMLDGAAAAELDAAA
jgi:putative protein-disulfide isomerase